MLAVSSLFIFLLQRKETQVLSRHKEVKKISDLILLRLAVSITKIHDTRARFFSLSSALEYFRFYLYCEQLGFQL